MATYTTNLNLKKQAQSDKIRIADINNNMDDIDAAFGAIGLETAFALSYTILVRGGCISEKDLIRLMCTRPREIAHLEQVKIDVGKPWKATLFDVSTPYRYDVKTSRSRSKNTPFDGFELYGKPIDLPQEGS